MKWPNVKLIFSRELRDQLRDRRTLFTVVVMPLILYPLMGMAMLQVAQFMREYPTKVWIVGEENLPAETPLIKDGELNPEYVNEKDRNLLQLSFSSENNIEFQSIFRDFRTRPGMKRAPALVDEMIEREMKERKLDLAVFIPSKFDSQDPESGNKLPEIFLFQNTANDKSRIGVERFARALDEWKTAFVTKSLSDVGVSITKAQGFRVNLTDVADQSGKKAAAWSKILPFIVMIWCLTGAFYPAIDLVAGEKERGTFETLLSSPAERSEIAIGKLLTVMTFSIATSILNLLSMGVTGLFVVARLGASNPIGGGMPIGAPPLSSIGWLLLALIPISALFSAIALAAAAFARSSKEGQYYLVPLMMISMPLMMVPMLPGAQLDFGTSLIPVSGLMLMLRGLIEGQYTECAQFFGPVCAVTLVCCWLSVRWAVHQFNSETVLFRASERFGIGSWMKHVMRERHDLPSFGNAILCAVVILMAKFFLDMVATTPANFADFFKVTLTILLAGIAAPAIMMAVVLTRNPAKSLRLKLCSFPVACAAIVLAILLNPLFTWFSAGVMYLYPPAGDLAMMQRAIDNILGNSPGLWATLLAIAFLPAVLEELAYRGFILSGLESMKNKWQAIFLTSLFFGMAHGVIQQSIMTFGVGMVLGLIAIQTRSIIPCILFHLTHNSLAVLLSQADSSVIQPSPFLSRILYSSDGLSYQYGLIPGALMTIAGVGLTIWFLRMKSNPETSVAGDRLSSTWFTRLFQPSRVG
jgi:sodium transport system permease protein